MNKIPLLFEMNVEIKIFLHLGALFINSQYSVSPWKYANFWRKGVEKKDEQKGKRIAYPSSGDE